MWDLKRSIYWKVVTLMFSYLRTVFNMLKINRALLARQGIKKENYILKMILLLGHFCL